MAAGKGAALKAAYSQGPYNYGKDVSKAVGEAVDLQVKFDHEKRKEEKIQKQKDEVKQKNLEKAYNKDFATVMVSADAPADAQQLSKTIGDELHYLYFESGLDPSSTEFLQRRANILKGGDYQSVVSFNAQQNEALDNGYMLVPGADGKMTKVPLDSNAMEVLGSTRTIRGFAGGNGQPKFNRETGQWEVISTDDEGNVTATPLKDYTQTAGDNVIVKTDFSGANDYFKEKNVNLRLNPGSGDYDEQLGAARTTATGYVDSNIMNSKNGILAAASRYGMSDLDLQELNGLLERKMNGEELSGPDLEHLNGVLNSIRSLATEDTMKQVYGPNYQKIEGDKKNTGDEVAVLDTDYEPTNKNYAKNASTLLAKGIDDITPTDINEVVTSIGNDDLSAFGNVSGGTGANYNSFSAKDDEGNTIIKIDYDIVRGGKLNKKKGTAYYHGTRIDFDEDNPLGPQIEKLMYENAGYNATQIKTAQRLKNVSSIVTGNTSTDTNKATDINAGNVATDLNILYTNKGYNFNFVPYNDGKGIGVQIGDDTINIPMTDSEGNMLTPTQYAAKIESYLSKYTK